MKKQRNYVKPLELNFVSGEHIRVSPVGSVTGIDGREFVIDGTALVGSVTQNKLHIALDENHSFGEALGWFDYATFEAREDGVYAVLELTEKGKGLIESKAYRYLSPVYMMGNNRNITGLDSVGLVNRPNVLNDALNTQEDGAGDSGSETVESENAALKEENSRLKSELHASKAAVHELNRRILDTLISTAVEKNELLPKQVEYAKTLSDEASLNSYLKANKVDVTGLTGRTTPKDGVNGVSAELSAFGKSIGLNDETLKKYVRD